jgi:hypothetical protein
MKTKMTWRESSSAGRLSSFDDQDSVHDESVNQDNGMLCAAFSQTCCWALMYRTTVCFE